MPNEVYEAAVEGLGSLVSPRIAKRIVDDSLRATSRTPDDVSRSAMRRLLLGRIRKELEGVMPAAAVGPGLKHLAATLEDAPVRERRPWWRRGARAAGSADAGPRERPAAAPPPVEHGEVDLPPTERRAGERRANDRRQTIDGRPADRRTNQPRNGLQSPDSIGVTRSSVYLPDVPLPPMPPVEPAGADANRGNGASAVAERVSVGTVGAARAATGKANAPLPELTASMVERAVRAFAELETVRQIVAVERGLVLQSSGEGLDAERLQGLSVATIALLSKAGTLRVFSLEHETGVLFLFPMRNGAIVVLTKPKVNIGAVLSARATLEEAA